MNTKALHVLTFVWLLVAAGQASGQQTCGEPGIYAWVPLSAGAGCLGEVCQVVPILSEPDFEVCSGSAIDVEASPEGTVLSADACQLFVANEQSCSVSFIDTDSFVTLPPVGCVGNCPSTVDVSASGTFL